MLRTLSIENIALIDSLMVEFSSGMNCLTGETGAGKSIMIDAISAGGSKILYTAVSYDDDENIIDVQIIRKTLYKGFLSY